MLIEEIWSSLKRVTGTCESDEIFRLLNLAIEMLAAEKLVDPLQGTIDFYTGDGYHFALPRDVKTPIRININNNPAFARSRLFEFGQNTDGSVDGTEVGWSWHDKGYSPIQDERKLPGRLRYVTTSEADNGKTIRVFGRDGDGYEQTETLTGDELDPDLSETIFVSVDRIVRDVTATETYLQTEAGENVARYYPDERAPEYRVIKLSQKAVACRMLYRRHTGKMTAQTDIIPVRSQLAIMAAVKAVMLMENEDPGFQAHFDKAIEFLQKEQATREENTTASGGMEIQTAINANIRTRDGIIAADIYDDAAEIFGPVGREKLFDRITDAVEALANKGEWDSLRGAVDIWTRDRSDVVNIKGTTGDGYFVLPREVDSILAINYDSNPLVPRNRWSEFHLNGTGERYKSPIGHWEDAGHVCILNPLPLDADTNLVKPRLLAAIPEDAADEDSEIRVYGIERLDDGTERVVYRDGVRGYLVPCAVTVADFEDTAPRWVRIDRITKEATSGFVSLYSYEELEASFDQDALLGVWEPDEREPNYRMIKVPSSKSERIRVLYRKRSARVSGLYDLLHLKNRLAIVNAMRAIKAEESDPNASELYMQKAVGYLKDQEWSLNPTQGMSLQFNEATWPGGFENIT